MSNKIYNIEKKIFRNNHSKEINLKFGIAVTFFFIKITFKDSLTCEFKFQITIVYFLYYIAPLYSMFPFCSIISQLCLQKYEKLKMSVIYFFIFQHNTYHHYDLTFILNKPKLKTQFKCWHKVARLRDLMEI